MAIKISGSTIIDDSRNIVAGVAATFTGNVTVGGTITYEDVTNIDSVGVITARSGIDCNGTLEVSSTSNFDDTLKIAEKIEHLGDDDTWFGFPDNNIFQLQTAGTTRIYVDSAGTTWNVNAATGISTTTKLINSATNASGNGVSLAFAPTQNYGTRFSSIDVVQDGNNNMYMAFKVTDANQDAHAVERMRITRTGQLITNGSATPYSTRSATFQPAHTNTNNYISIIAGNTTSISGITFGDAAGQSAGNYAGMFEYYHDGDYLIYKQNNSEKLRITSTGNVGIGLTNPQKLLDLYAANPTIGVKATGGNDASLELIETGGSAIDFGETGSAGFRIRYDGGDNKLFFTSGSDTTTNNRVAILRDSGYVGIGTVNPTSLLTVGARPKTTSAAATVLISPASGNASIQLRGGSPTLEFDGTGGGNGRIFTDGADLAISNGTLDGAGTELVRITSAGNVGIGTITPIAPLHVQKANGEIARFGDITASVYQGLFIKNDVSDYPAIENSDSNMTIAMRAAGSIQMEIDANNNDTAKYFRVTANATGASGTEIFKVQEDGQLQATGAADVRLTLGSSGTAGTNDSVHIRADSADLKFMAADGGTTIFETNGTETLRITSEGYVRIGGNEGNYQTVIVDESNRTTTAETSLLLYAKHDGTGNTGVGFGGGIKFWGDRNGDNAEQTMGNIMCVADVNSGTTLSGALTFETAAAGVPTEKLRITSDGKVGINKTPDASGGLVQFMYNEGYQSGATNLLTSASKAVLRLQTSNDSSKSLYFGGIDEHATPYLQVGNKGTDGATAVYSLVLQPFGGSVRVGNNDSFSAHAAADDLVVGTTSGSNGMTILTGDATGNIFFNNGSANNGVIQYVHSTDPDSMIINSAGQIEFDAGGSERLRINSTGIATFYQGFSLENGGAVRFSVSHTSGGNVLVKNPTAANISFQTTTNSDQLQLHNNGNIGIGVGSPDTKLHVETSGSTGITFEGSSSNTNAISGDAGTYLMLKNKSATDNNFSNILGVDAGGQATSQISFISKEQSTNAGELVFGTRVASGSMTERLRITSDGEVGIGTVAPDETLELWKASGTNLLKISSEANSTIGIEIEKTGSTTQSWRIADGQSVNGMFQIYDVTDNKYPFNIDTAQRVLLGSTSNRFYAAKLQVQGANDDNYIMMHNTTAGDADGNRYSKLVYSGTQSGGETSDLAHINAAHDGAADDQKGRLEFRVNTGAGNHSPTEALRIHSTGQVELKVPDSVATLKLTPSGTNAPAVIDFNTPGTGSAVFKVQNSEKLRITSGGDLGLGETVPGAKLHVLTSSQDVAIFESINNAPSGPEIFLKHSPGAGQMQHADTIGLIQFQGRDTNNNETIFSSIRAIAADVTHNDEKGDLTFWTRTDASTFTEKLRIKGNGNVGIGTISPENGLHVSDGSNYASPQNSGAGKVMIEHASSADLQFMTANSGYNHIFFGDQDDANIGSIVYHHASNSNTMVFNTNTNEALRINASGHVGIKTDVMFNGALLSIGNGQGANTPSGEHIKIGPSANTITFLDSPSNASDTGNIQLWNTVYNNCSAKIELYHPAANLGGIKFYTTPAAGSPVEALRITSDGKVGIGTDEPFSNLTVYGENRSGGGSVTGQITAKDNAAYNASPTGGLVFQGHYHSNGANAVFGGITGFKENADNGDYAGALAFHVRANGAVSYEALRITSGGTVTSYNGIETVSIGSTEKYCAASNFSTFSMTVSTDPQTIYLQIPADIRGGKFAPADGDLVSFKFSKDGLDTRTFVFEYDGTGFTPGSGKFKLYNGTIFNDGSGTVMWRFSKIAQSTGSHSTDFNADGFNYYRGGGYTFTGMVEFGGPPLNINTVVGIGTEIPTDPQTTDRGALLAVAGIVTATKYYGDGSNLTGISAGGFSQDDQGNLVAGTGAGPASDNANTIYNVSIGCNAGASLTTGDCNTFIGHNAGRYSTTNGLSVFIGRNAGMMRTANNDYNIAIGYAAGSCSDKGNSDDNIAIGRLSGKWQDGCNNVSIGMHAGACMTSGHFNVALGHNALIGSATTTSNTGGCNIVFGKESGGVLTSGSNNVLIGCKAGGALTSATNTIALGEFALGTGALTGNENVAIGLGAGCKMTSGQKNVLIGGCAGKCLTTSNYNTIIGAGGAGHNLTGQSNVFLGYQVAFSAGDAGYNIGIGRQAFEQLSTGEMNVAIGYQGMDNVTTGKKNTGIGQYAGNCLTTGCCNSFLGQNAEPSNPAVNNEITLGASNIERFRVPGIGILGNSDGVGIGTTNPAHANALTGNTKVLAVGVVTANYFYGDGSNLTNAGGFSQDSEANLVAGTGAGAALDADTCYNILIGCSAGAAIDSGDDNVLFGQKSGLVLTSGSHNFMVGCHAGKDMTTSSCNIAIGLCAMSAHTTGHSGTGNNVAIGKESLQKSNCFNNIGIGKAAGKGGSGTVSYKKSVFIGVGAGENINSGNCNIFMGQYAGKGDGTNGITGNDNVIIGQDAGCLLSSGSSNVFIGKCAGRDTTTGSKNIAIGICAMNDGTTTGEQNIAIGCDAGGAITSGSYNLLFGRDAGRGMTSASNNMAFGTGTLGGDLNCDFTGTGNIIMGNLSVVAGTSADYNVVMGHNAGRCITTGDYNQLFGAYVAQRNRGSHNFAVGYTAISGTATAADNTGSCNIALGKAAGYCLSTGSRNIMIGCNANKCITTGSQNVSIGSDAGKSTTTGEFNVFLGGNAGWQTTTQSHNVFMGWCAGCGVTDGGKSTFIGYYGGSNAAYALCSTSIGLKSGPGVSPYCSTNDIFIGATAGKCLSTSCNNIVIGHAHVGAHLVADGSNQLSIGISSNYWIAGDSSFNIKTRNITPTTTDTYNLGSGSLRWANIYTNDLQLSNESKKDTGGNDVDGTWGDWTLQEGENDIFMINNRTGKKFKINMTEVL